MSAAFFCDRCGRAYPFEWQRQIVSKGFKWGNTYGHTRDLCPECVAALKEFMNEENNNKGSTETGDDI